MKPWIQSCLCLECTARCSWHQCSLLSEPVLENHWQERRKRHFCCCRAVPVCFWQSTLQFHLATTDKPCSPSIQISESGDFLWGRVPNREMLRCTHEPTKLIRGTGFDCHKFHRLIFGMVAHLSYWLSSIVWCSHLLSCWQSGCPWCSMT